MSDRRFAIGLLGREAPTSVPADFAGQLLTATSTRRHGDQVLSLWLAPLHPLMEDPARHASSLDRVAAAAGAGVAWLDPLFNLTAPPAWAGPEWSGAWVADAGLLDALFLRELRWSLGWNRRDLAEGMSAPVREALLVHHGLVPSAHGVVLQER